MYNLFILGLGGFLGAISRYLLSGYVQNLFKQDGFPYGTLVVNILGCFVLGMLTHAAAAKGMFDAQTRLFLMVGFVGAFTTFSTFAFKSVELFMTGRAGQAFVAIMLNLNLGLVLAWGGYRITGLFT